MLSFRVSYYNSHPRMGMNDRLLDSNADWYSFQPTPPYGDERFTFITVHLLSDFNPHPRMGMNNKLSFCYSLYFISTHTPAWG